MPRRPFNLLTHDAIRLGSSQFKDNFQDPSRDLENCNIVFYFSKKEDIDTITAALTDAQIPFKDTELTSGEYKLFVALPEEEHVCESNNLLFENFEKLEIYTKGDFPPYWLENGLSSEDGVIYVINTCALGTHVFGECVFDTLVFCKNVTLAEESIISSEEFNPTLIFNAELYSEEFNSVALQEYNVVLATPSDPSNIAEGTFAGNILNLEYHGEWNTTARNWFSGEINYLNGIPTPDPRINPLSKITLIPGALLFYDKIEKEYGVAQSENISSVLEHLNQLRYETNYDTYVGTVDGTHHFVANDDAVAGNTLYSDDVAATPCFYRLEIDNTANGSVTFSAASGNSSIDSATISWNAGDTMTFIVAKFTALNTTNITFSALNDGKGVGLEIGGYGNNTLTVSGAPTGCTVIDCSELAMLKSKNANTDVGGNYIPGAGYTFIGEGTHHNFRGASAQSVLGATVKSPDSICIANTGYNYSPRVGINFARFKEWALTNGEDAFYDDGEGGQNASVGHVMRKSRFNTEVTDYTGSDPHRLGMKDYYTHLLTDQSDTYAELREEYEAYYGNMNDMYDAYLMSHCMNLKAVSGTTADLRNYGMTQTRAKADCLNVNYNYKFIPAYPPEYNAQQYGKISEGFLPGNYYHPEPGDIGLMFRDDVMAIINENVTTVGAGTRLDNSMYRGSCADSSSNVSWCFGGRNGCFGGPYRSEEDFRCRPVLALKS